MISTSCDGIDYLLISWTSGSGACPESWQKTIFIRASRCGKVLQVAKHFTQAYVADSFQHRCTLDELADCSDHRVDRIFFRQGHCPLAQLPRPSSGNEGTVTNSRRHDIIHHTKLSSTAVDSLSVVYQGRRWSTKEHKEPDRAWLDPKLLDPESPPNQVDPEASHRAPPRAQATCIDRRTRKLWSSGGTRGWDRELDRWGESERKVCGERRTDDDNKLYW